MLRILQVNEVRRVRGFEKPGIQWTVIALGIALMILLVAATVRIRTLQDLLRRADQVMSTEGKRRETLERDLARERSTREALALELARVRSGAACGGSGDAAAGPPTLTLDPVRERSGSPPAVNIDSADPDTVVELRLLLPDTASSELKQLNLTARDWTTGAVRWSLGAVRVATADGRRAAVAQVSGEMIAPGVFEFVLAPVGEGGPQPEAVAAYELAVNPRAAR
jgi:hypothetical protein